MEVVTKDQGPLGLEHEFSHAGDHPSLEQDDEFDLTIGGEDDLDPKASDYDTHDNLADDADETERGDEASFDYEAEKQGNVVDDALALEAGDLYNEDGRDEMLELNVDIVETTGNTNEGHESNELEQNGSVSEPETSVRHYTEDHAEGIVEEEVYYQETDNELETFDDGAQPQTDLGSDYMEQSTSVDNVLGNEETQNPDLETTANEDQASNDQSAIVEYDKMETSEVLASDDAAAFGFETNELAEGEVHEEGARYVGGEFGGGEPSYDGDDQEQLSPQKDSMAADVFDEAQAQDSWDEEEHDDEDSDTHPKVTISYQSQEYSLFAEFSGQDPDFYFLADLASFHQPLSQLLANLRVVISDEIAPSQEVFLRVNGLGFEFGESTTKDFLDETTLAQIVELNKRLVANEGGSPSAILHCYLSLRPSCTHRFSELSKAADEGKGLSDIAMFYDDASVDESAEEDEEHDFSQDMISESVSLEAAVGDEDATGKQDETNETEQYYNPFRQTKEQFPMTDDVSIPIAAEGEFAEQDELSEEALGVENTEFEDANAFENASGEIDDGFEATTAEALDDAHGFSEHEEGAYGESAAGDVELLDVEQHTEAELSPEDDGETNGEALFSFPPSSTCGVEDLCLCFNCLRPHFVDMGASWALISLPETPVPAGSRSDDGAPHFPTVTVSSAEEGGKEVGRVKLPRKDMEADMHNQEDVVNPADDQDDNDDDYLDLGNDEGQDGANERPMDSAIEIGEEMAKSSTLAGASPQTPHQSSATATLDGNDNGPETTAPKNQDPLNATGSQNEANNVASNGQEDEIDWNHEDEGDLDEANQNPATLSPSSPSAKRYREEDENTDGTGDETGEYCHPTVRRIHANKPPAIKRRRT